MHVKVASLLTPNSEDNQALVQGPGGPCAPVKPTTLHARSLREHGDLHVAISARTIPGFPGIQISPNVPFATAHGTEALPHPGRENPTLSFHGKAAEGQFDVKMTE